MNNDSKTFTRLRGPRTFGVPGGSARATMRNQRASWLTMTWQKKLFWLFTITVVGGVLGAASGNSPLIGAGIAAGAATLIAVALTAPDALIILGISLLYMPFIAPLAALYAGHASGGGRIDLIGATVSLFLTYLVAVWVAVKWSRNRRWVTILLVAVSTVVPGIFLVNVVPGLGLNAARVSVLLVLATRCGGWAWVSGMTMVTVDTLRARLGRAVDDGLVQQAGKADDKVLKVWATREEAEKLTADRLSGLDNDYACFHDVRTKNTPGVLGQVLIGPGGGFLLASAYTDGEMVETRKDGVVFSGVALTELTATLYVYRESIAKITRSPQKDFTLLLVVHGPNVVDVRQPLAVYEGESPLPVATVILVSADRLVDEVAPGFVVWSKLRCAQAVRRVRMRTGNAAAPANLVSTNVDTRLAVMDEQGRSVKPEESGMHVQDLTQPADWMFSGEPCRVVTTLGILSGLCLVGAPYEENGRWLVNVCRLDEWDLAYRSGREPVAYPYPVSSVDTEPVPSVALLPEE